MNHKKVTQSVARSLYGAVITEVAVERVAPCIGRPAGWEVTTIRLLDGRRIVLGVSESDGEPYCTALLIAREGEFVVYAACKGRGCSTDSKYWQDALDASRKAMKARKGDD